MRLLLIVSLPAGAMLAIWLGLVPGRYLPFASLDVREPDPWFLDLRLAALKSDAPLCRATLTPTYVSAEPIADEPLRDGCGWTNSVALREVAQAKLSIDKLSCPMAAALTMWMMHHVQPAALSLLKSKVVAVRHMGGYACRNIMGVKRLKAFRSQHATANAIDISAFELEDGRVISLAKGWTAPDAQSEFLRRIHHGACMYFRVAVGPDFNAAHHNHFHLDRGGFKSCR